MRLETQFLEFHSFLKQGLRQFPTALWLNDEGEILEIQYSCIEDVGTLPTAAQTAHKYLQIQDGDIVILNDPYSGGSILSSLTLVSCVTLELGGKRDCPKFLFASRIYFKPRVRLTDSIEQEGLRIPPTPIVVSGKKNTDLLTILSQHPAAPQDLVERLEVEVERIQNHFVHVQQAAKSLSMIPNKKFQRAYFKKTKERLLSQLSEHAYGRVKVGWDLEDDAKINLQMELNEKRLEFDFTDTSRSAKWNLTHGATLGACLVSTLAFLGKDIPINNGVFEALQVTAPEGSFVNARYPAPVFLGMTDGVNLIAHMILKAFSKLDRRFKFAQSGLSQCSFEIDFESSGHFFDQLETGAPGTNHQRGPDGLNLWRRSHLQPSVEKVEQRFPLLIRSYAFRHKSGGSGENPGGNGVTKVVEVLKDAQLKWLFSDLMTKPEGVAGGKSASTPEIHIQQGLGKKQKPADRLSTQGQLSVTSGTQVVVHSSGGGGYGEKADVEE